MGTFTYQTAIESRFATAWGATTPVAYDNVPFDLSPTEQPWVRFEIYDGDIDKASIGNSPQIRRYTGTIYASVYVPKNTAAVQARQLADQIITIFRDYNQSGLTCYEATLKRIGEQYASGAGSSISATVASTQWYVLLVAIPFRFDEIV